jgi:hypothetical protein
MFFTYSPQLRRDIEDALSTDRLTAYRNAAGGDLERAIDLYVWNAGTAAAFFGPIGVLEITLRNALDRELSRTFRGPWFDDPAFLRIDANVAGRIRKIKQKIIDRGAAVTQPRGYRASRAETRSLGGAPRPRPVLHHRWPDSASPPVVRRALYSSRYRIVVSSVEGSSDQSP